MDDNKGKPGENQPPQPSKPTSSKVFGMSTPLGKEQQPRPVEKPSPIYETVPVNPETNQPEQAVPPAASAPASPELEPEEVPSEVASPEQALKASPVPPTGPPPPPHGPSRDTLKFFILGGGVAMFFFVFYLIFSFLMGGKAETKPTTLTYWGLWEEKEIYDPLIALYKVKNPNVTITYQKMTPQDFREKLIARGKNGQGPDLFRFHNTWLPEMQEVVAPLPESVMSASEFEQTFYPIHSKDLKIDKHYYGIPLSIDGLVLVYNNGLFKKAGISKPPTTWEEITDYVSKLAVKDKDGQLINSALAIGTASNVEHFSDLFGLMLVQNGGSLQQLDQPEAAGALESYRKLSEPPTDFWNDAMPNSITAFIQEKVAMIIVPSWEILAIKAANPDIELKVVGTPNLPGSTQVAIASYWVEGVSKFSPNQVEAWKFLKFLSEKENLTKRYELQSKTRLFGEPYSRVDLGTTLAQNEYIGPVIQQANNYVSLPLISRTHDNGLNDEIVKYVENAINATIQGVSYAEALRVASQGVNQVLDRFKIE
jgi:multiple sugar transport system substrate-binding protein